MGVFEGGVVAESNLFEIVSGGDGPYGVVVLRDGAEVNASRRFMLGGCCLCQR